MGLLAWNTSLARPKLHGLLALDKLDEALGLLHQTIDNLPVLEAILRVEEFVDLRQKDPFRIQKRVAVTKDHLQLFHRSQCAPLPGSQSYKTDRPPLEAL